MPALGRSASGSLRLLDVGHNRLGDGGVIEGLVPLLAGVASDIEVLRMDAVGCGDAGVVAVAANLPKKITALDCSDNFPLGARAGVAALVATLPSLQHLLDLEPVSLQVHAPHILVNRENRERELLAEPYSPTSPSYVPFLSAGHKLGEPNGS